MKIEKINQSIRDALIVAITRMGGANHPLALKDTAQPILNEQGHDLRDYLGPDWSFADLSEDYDWVTVDHDGEVYASDMQPHPVAAAGAWGSDGLESWDFQMFGDRKVTHAANWQELIWQRPTDEAANQPQGANLNDQ